MDIRGSPSERLCLGLGLARCCPCREVLGHGLAGGYGTGRHRFEFALELLFELAFQLRGDRPGQDTGCRACSCLKPPVLVGADAW